MAVKNDFSLGGIASSVQYGKAGGKVLYDSVSKVFTVRLADDTTFASFAAESVTAVEGNIVIQDAAGKLSFLTTNAAISSNQDSVIKVEGNAIVIPSGLIANRPTVPEVGMIRVNTEAVPSKVEFYNGVAWAEVGQNEALPNFSAIAPIELESDPLTGYTFKLQVVPVAYGGTGISLIPKNRIPYGNDESPMGTSSGLTFDDTTQQLRVGTLYPVAINGNTGAIQAVADNSDLILLPNGGGRVVAGGVGATILTAGPGEMLTIRGTSSSVEIDSEQGDTVFRLASGATNKISIQGPSDVDYATGLTSNDLVNKYYVDQLFGALNGGSF